MKLYNNESTPVRWPACELCGCDVPESLCTLDGRTLCGDCSAAAQGRAIVEEHHVIGRASSDETVPLPASAHFFQTRSQRRWPECLKQPTADPVLIIARYVRAIVDFARWVTIYGERFSDWLVALAQHLRERLGDGWWTALAPLWRDQST